MAYLEITLNVDAADRPSAAEIYTRYKQPFLDTIEGATGKELLIRDEDVQVLHRFDSVEQARAYLGSELFKADVVAALLPLMVTEPEIRIYDVA